MEESSTSRDVNKIQTFVFIDLEATGLPYDSPRILELSMIAVSREDLLHMNLRTSNNKSSSSPGTSSSQPSPTVSTNEQPLKNRCVLSQPSPASSNNGDLSPTSTSPPDSPKHDDSSVPELPRVMHKYTRLYYPWKLVTPKAEEITGLNNDLLQHLSGFTQVSAQALALFLDLPKPVTLVAHNGNRYDFRLLMSELKNVESEDDFSELQCTDTLKAIRDIDALYEKEDIQELSKLAESFFIDDMLDDLMEADSPPSNKRLCSEEAGEVRLSQGSRNLARINESLPQVNQGHHHVLEVTGELPITPVKKRQPACTATPATPHKPAQPPPSPITAEFGKACATPAKKETSNVRRSLTYEGPGKRKLKERMPYKQVNIYQRLFGSDYSAHRAESDCQALLEICGHYGGRFVEWADTFSERFSEMKPMWIRRKTFTVT